MAGETDFFAGLGDADLAAFNKSVAENDPWRIAAAPINQWKPDESTWSSNQSAGAAAVKGFLSGFLSGQAKNNEADQLKRVTAVLPQLYADPMGVSAPEGVDNNAFAGIQSAAALNDYQRQALLQADRVKSARDAKLALVKDPSKMIVLKNTAPSLFESMFGNVGAAAPIEAAPIAPASQAPTLNLSNGKTPTELRRQQLYSSNLLATGDQVAARQAADRELEAEMKANASSFDAAKEARDKATQLQNIVGTARAGMAEAGQTGSTLASTYEHYASQLPWATEAKRQAAGDTMINSVVPAIVKEGRWPGALAVQEMEALKQSGPSASNTPEANQALVDRMEAVSKHLYDYADFLEAYKDTNSGSTVGASKAWSAYERAYPLYKDNTLNTERPSWHDFFSGDWQSGLSAAPAATSGTSQVPAGYKLQRNKVTGETRIVPQ